MAELNDDEETCIYNATAVDSLGNPYRVVPFDEAIWHTCITAMTIGYVSSSRVKCSMAQPRTATPRSLTPLPTLLLHTLQVRRDRSAATSNARLPDTLLLADYRVRVWLGGHACRLADDECA